MPKIHAVIYSRGRFAWISVAEWIAEGAGILKLSGLGDASLAPLAQFVEDSLEENAHKILPDTDGLVFEPQVPRLLLFRLDEEDWVARGFQPWGSVAPDPDDPDAGVRLRLVASDEESEEDEGYLWARAAARLLYQMRDGGSGGASQQALDLVPTRSLDGSIAFPSTDDVNQAFDPGAAADFGNAADAGN